MRARTIVYTMTFLLGAAGSSRAQITTGTFSAPGAGFTDVLPSQGVYGQSFLAPANARSIQLFSIFVDGFYGFDASQTPFPAASRLPPNGAGTSLRIFSYDPNSFYQCLDPADCAIQLVYTGSTFIQYTNQPQWLTFSNLNVPVLPGGHYLTALDAEYNPADPNFFTFLRVPDVSDPGVAGFGFVDGTIDPVGMYRYRVQYATVTPEPESWVLLLSGLAALAWAGRWKRRARRA
ncbi:MAG TPA: PEP-CTERM sorting domain-containing protein [Longimicrobiales bacterium]